MTFWALIKKWRFDCTVRYAKISRIKTDSVGSVEFSVLWRNNKFKTFFEKFRQLVNLMRFTLCASIGACAFKRVFTILYLGTNETLHKDLNSPPLSNY
jgi:hypothetical protein